MSIVYLSDATRLIVKVALVLPSRVCCSRIARSANTVLIEKQVVQLKWFEVGSADRGRKRITIAPVFVLHSQGGKAMQLTARRSSYSSETNCNATGNAYRESRRTCSPSERQVPAKTILFADHDGSILTVRRTLSEGL